MAPRPFRGVVNVDIRDSVPDWSRATAKAPPGACHSPHHAPKDWIEQYAGKFDIGYEAIREQTLARQKPHPSLGRVYLECAYAPMVELLGYLTANGFTNYIAAGGGRDFMRPVSQEMYGHPAGAGYRQQYHFRVQQPREARRHHHHKPEADYLDDGPEKPVRIWNRTRRRVSASPPVVVLRGVRLF